MKRAVKFFFSFLLVLCATTSYATVDTVRFTGAQVYIPDNFNCHVGDTVLFKGSFANHPLTQDQVPNGADPIDAGSSIASYYYHVKAVGTYKFHCANHGGSGTGMHGAFTAAELGVGDSPQPKPIDLSQNYPNPVKTSTTIEFHLKKISSVSLKVFTSDGKEIAILAQGTQAEGHHIIPFDALHLAPGAYFYRLSIDAETLTKQLIVIK